LLNEYKLKYSKYLQSTFFAVITLILIKTIFQIIVIRSGLRWLTADDYCRTVISYEWLQHPKIYAGVWLALHFWINGLFIAVFKDLTLAPVLVNTIFSILTLIYLFLLLYRIFNKMTAYISCVIFAVFPFQVWLSTSGMPESIFFFFIIAACYYFILWFESTRNNTDTDGEVKYLIYGIVSLNLANLLRYEGWLFSLTFIVLVFLTTYKKYKFTKKLYINTAVSLFSLISVIWWLYQNYADNNDAFFFIKETTKIFKDLNAAGFWQRVVQYPFFVFYIAPLTTILGLRKVYLVLRNRRNGFEGNFSLLRIFLLFNMFELIFLMLTGIFGSGGTNMISRYVVVNAMLLFPFAVWQLLDFRKYVAVLSLSTLILVNVIWSFYYQQAYREDTYEVADLTKRLIQKNYFEPEDKIYFEMVEGYYDIYPLQVISNTPDRFNMDTIPSSFPTNISSKKISKKKRAEEQQRLNILELRKFLEEKKIKLFIARSDLLIDKLKKLSYKSEQIGDYHIFYLSDKKIKYKNSGNPNDYEEKIPPNAISFGRKLLLKDFRIDNTNFGLNPQTITLKWGIADMSMLDSLASDDDDFGRYRIKIELVSPDSDSSSFETFTRVFSERNVEEYFETEEIKNILILKPFALLNYSRKFKLSPFESGMYDVRLSVLDADKNDRELRVYRGDSLYTYQPDTTAAETASDTIRTDIKLTQSKLKKLRERYNIKPFYLLGRVIAMFPNANYNEIVKRSKEFSQLIIRNGIMLPFLQRYQGDQFLNVVFNYF
jgi:4-amino-4-deoxy-L-arabinose transferase-like glycosyltransferase